MNCIMGSVKKANRVFLSRNYLNNRVFLSRNYRLIVAPPQRPKEFKECRPFQIYQSAPGLLQPACRGFPAVQIRQRKPTADWQISNGMHSLNSFGRWVLHRSYWESYICDQRALASIFSETVGGMKLKFGEEIEKKRIYHDPSPFRWVLLR